VYLSNDFW